MKRAPRPYNNFQLVSVILMVSALLWLSVSAPFVYASQQANTKVCKIYNNSTDVGSDEESSNGFSNTTEEKPASSGSNIVEEYLHDHYTSHTFFPTSMQYHASHNAVEYIAYHGEVQVPPPNVA